MAHINLTCYITSITQEVEVCELKTFYYVTANGFRIRLSYVTRFLGQRFL